MKKAVIGGMHCYTMGMAFKVWLLRITSYSSGEYVHYSAIGILSMDGVQDVYITENTISFWVV